MKIRDVIHYYLGCDCMVMGEEAVAKIKSVWHDGLVGIDYNGIGETEHIAEDVFLLLRPLSSMTEEEYKEIRDKLSIDVVGAIQEPFRWVDKPKHVLVLENRLQTNTLRFNDGILLMKRGYDLFKLIETGEAIDITKINKDGLFKR